jgi:hypothetical protein
VEKKIRIPYSHITSITKENTALVIPNAIAIATNRKEYLFRSFWDRDGCHQLLQEFTEKYKRYIVACVHIDISRCMVIYAYIYVHPNSFICISKGKWPQWALRYWVPQSSYISTYTYINFYTYTYTGRMILWIPILNLNFNYPPMIYPCLCIHIFVYIYIHIYAPKYVHLYTYIYIHRENDPLDPNIGSHFQLPTHDMYIYIYVYLFVWIYMCIYIYILIYIYPFNNSFIRENDPLDPNIGSQFQLPTHDINEEESEDNNTVYMYIYMYICVDFDKIYSYVYMYIYDMY